MTGNTGGEMEGGTGIGKVGAKAGGALEMTPAGAVATRATSKTSNHKQLTDKLELKMKIFNIL